MTYSICTFVPSFSLPRLTSWRFFVVVFVRDCLTRLNLSKTLNLLQATVAEVITDGSIESLEQYLDIDELPDPEAEPAPNDNPEPAESRWKTDRKEWEWEEEARSFTSKGKVQRRFCSMEGCNQGGHLLREV